MSLTNIQNKTNLRLAVIVLSAAVLSCATVKELTSGGDSESGKVLYEGLPTGMEHAEQDYGATDPSAFKIIMPGPGQILLQDPESQPIDIATLGTKVREILGTRALDKRVAYIAVAVDVPASEVAAVVDELRRQNIETVKLITSARDPEVDEGGFFSSSTVAPDRVFEVKTRTELVPDPRPSPLALFIRIGPSETPEINNEPQADLRALTARIKEVFNEREQNGVFRVRTSEVEKTVLIELSADETDRKYGDLVKLVNAVKGAGAYPIVFGEGFKISEALEISTTVEKIPERPTRKSPPDVISGGVLNGKAVSLPKPSYPPAARAVKATGSVSVQITVDTEGNVIEANAVSGHPLLRQAAVSAARNSMFAPTLLSGKPVKVKGVLIFHFVN